MNESKVMIDNNDCINSEESIDDIRTELEELLLEMSRSYIVESF